jgi:hypothetical protein
MGLAIGHPLPRAAKVGLSQALRDWQNGDRALSNIRLAQLGAPRLRADAAEIIGLAKNALDQGLTADELLVAIELDPALYLVKYDRDQPRVPAGNSDGGRWSKTGGDAPTTAKPTAASPTGVFSVSLDATTDVTAWSFAGLSRVGFETLAALAARLTGPVSVAGFLLIPTPNGGGIAEGTIESSVKIGYRFDGPEGQLTLSTPDANGDPVSIVAHSRNNTFVDADGRTLGQKSNDQLILDQRTVAAALAAAGVAAQLAMPAALTDEDDKPRACPAPGPDVPHGTTQRALDYEDDVHQRVNPSDPTPRGFAYLFVHASKGSVIYADDCFHKNGGSQDPGMKAGDIVSAKGPGWAQILRIKNAEDKLFNEALRYSEIAQQRGRKVKYYFAEKAAEIKAIELFKRFKNVVIDYMPPRSKE